MTARHQAGSLLCVIALVGGLSTFAVSAAGEEVRTETTLGGFSISANAAPIKIQLDDPELPIPRPEEGAVVEANPAYTQADLGSGPAGYGLASTLWPGNLLGTGLPTATDNAVSQYPLKTEARYPDKPFTANGSIDFQGQHFADTNGTIMRASALGLDVSANARLNPADLPGTVDVGTVASESKAWVSDKNVAMGRSRSDVSNLELLGGIIKIGSVRTLVETTSDGSKADSSGSTVVTGLTVGPVGLVVDDQGARATGAPVPGSPPPPSDGLAALKAVGITIDGVVQTSTKDAETAVRSARGLRITVETTLLRTSLNGVIPGPVTEALYGIFSNEQIPPEYRGNLYYLLAATPKITFILGAGQSSSSANKQVGFDFEPPPTAERRQAAPPAANGGSGTGLGATRWRGGSAVDP